MDTRTQTREGEKQAVRRVGGRLPIPPPSHRTPFQHVENQREPLLLLCGTVYLGNKLHEFLHVLDKTGFTKTGVS